MHSLYFVLVDSKEFTIDTARKYVYDALEEEGFISTGYWGGGKADWYVIGGRWSGVLSWHGKAKEEIDKTPRDSYSRLGEGDDAMLLTKELITSLNG